MGEIKYNYNMITNISKVKSLGRVMGNIIKLSIEKMIRINEYGNKY